jgi:FkbM family methyltransferase
MALDLAESAQREIYYFGTYERKESALVRRLLRPGDAVWDVGANVGYYTLLAAACVGPEGRVVGFEPFPAATRRLEANVRLNGFDHVRCVQAAVADTEGRATLFHDGAQPDGVASLLRAGQGLLEVTCTTLSLDRFQAESGERPPRLVKVDVEGAEMAVLMGAAGLLSGAEAPMLLVEMEESHVTWRGASRADIQEMLTRWGFVGLHREGRRWRRFRDVRWVRQRNLFWVKPGDRVHRERCRSSGIVDAELAVWCRTGRVEKGL